MNRLCRGYDSKFISADVYRLDSNTTLVGSAKFSLSLLNNNPKLKLETFLNEESTGILSLLSFSYISKKTFLDYIYSGIEITPVYAIDFSQPFAHSPNNLTGNPYLNSVKYIQNILQNFIQDPFYPVLGTGATFVDFETDSNCFALTGNIFQPEILTFGMLDDYYKSTLSNIKPNSMNVFGEIIENMIKMIHYYSKEVLKYYVLVIVSAGNPTDSQRVLNAYNTITNLPMSVIDIRVNDTNTSNIETKSSTRNFYKACEYNEIGTACEAIGQQIIEYYDSRDLDVNKKSEKNRFSIRSSTLKLSPDKFRGRSTYFTYIKAEYIELLKKNGSFKEYISQINQIGVPFLKEGFSTISEAKKKRSKSFRHQSLVIFDFSCVNCKQNVNILEVSACGCRNFCINCVKSCKCPNCSEKLNLS